jgi:hypothetical protein
VAKSKKSDSTLPAPLSQTARVLNAVPTEILLGAALLVLLFCGGYYGWKKWGVPVTQQSEYRLALESIEITPPPTWIRSDVKAEATRDGSLDNLSIFDKDLTVRVYRAFEMHAWVEQVNRVSKRPPARVIVELKYRCPVAWVEVPAGVLPNNEVGLLPVDRNGVLLPPGDFTQEHADDYVRISVANLTPCGIPGTPWGDPRVSAAAEIAAVLGEDAHRVGVHRILVGSAEETEASNGQSVYRVVARSGLRFIWGSAPGREATGEPRPPQKKLRLIQLAESKVDPASQSPPQEIDLRDPGAGNPSERTTELPHPAVR